MKIHEYQARDLLRSYGIPVPPGQMIESIEDAATAFKAVTEANGGSPLAVVKAQVHAGGRGKAGFVKLVRSAEEATAAARFMLTHRMKSPQTPPEGLEVRRLLIAAGVEIAPRAGGGREEFYLAITTDRKTRRNVLIASREGGVEIEQVAHDKPEAILKEPLHPLLGMQAHQARRIAFDLGFAGKHVGQAAAIMQTLARLYVEKDCTLAEINPLVLALEGAPARAPGAGDRADERPPGAQSTAPSSSVLAIDAKFNFDDNAIFRHKDVAAMFDPTEENPAELRARRFGLSYIALDGTIGCLVNGAGLAMATMDIVKLHGGEPANFLDVGGSASEEAVTEAFSIILSDPKVKGVLVNIFGGIMRCDIIAQGIVNAAKGHRNPDGSTGFKVPLVVRLEGTNVEAGRALLQDARRDIPTMQAATDLADAARKVCAAVADG
jgi:succinyl-CoA synthetase beta subunit